MEIQLNSRGAALGYLPKATSLATEAAQVLSSGMEEFAAFLADNDLKSLELYQFDPSGLTFTLVWSRTVPVPANSCKVFDIHNTSLIEVLVHGDPVSTVEYSSSSFRDWECLESQTGCRYFLTLPLLLFSHLFLNYVLLVASDNPVWEDVLRTMIQALERVLPRTSESELPWVTKS